MQEDAFTNRGMLVIGEDLCCVGDPATNDVLERLVRVEAPAALSVAVKAGTLDDRSDVQPVVQVWCDDKQPWVDLGDVTAMAQES